MQLKFSDRQKRYFGYIRKWAHSADKKFLCKVALNICELIRCDRSAIISTKKRGSVMLFLSLKLAPKM